VFENDDFIAWANENCVVAVGHSGATPGNEDHKPVTVTDPKTKESKEICPKYAGLTCAEHQAVRSSAEQSPPEGWDKMPESKGVPNNAVFTPDGKVQKLDNKDALVAKTLIDTLTAHQPSKKDDKPIAFKKWDAYNKAFDEGDKATADGKWKAAITAYAKVDADAKKLSKGITDKLAAKAKDLNDKVAAKFGEIKDGSGDDAAKLKDVKALRAEVGAKLSTGGLAVLADIDAFIKEHSAPAAPPK
jgi:hypothetical protein